MSTSLTITRHAIERWQERVDRTASANEARLCLIQLISLGRVRPNPRHWTAVDPTPGTSFVYWARRPNVCAVLFNDAVVTVLTRALCRASAQRPRSPGDTPRLRLVTEEPSWRWDGVIEQEAA